MKLAIWIFATLAILSLSNFSRADEQNAPVRNPAQLNPSEESYSEPGTPMHHASSANGIGVMVQGYYDPTSTYLKMQTAFAPTGFGSQSAAGMWGMQVMATYLVHSHFELAAGFDYVFPINAQGQQTFTGQYAVNSQTFNLMGVKLLQIGYEIDFGNFSVIPYGSVGMYFGKNQVTLNTASNQTDVVTFSKLMATFTAGVRGEFNLNKNFSIGGAFEAFMPSNVNTQLSQSGSSTLAELPGYESSLQSQMDFMTSVGIRVLGDVKATF